MALIKILYCTDILGLGGVERRRLSLAKVLVKKNYEIKIICSVIKRHLYKEFEALGVEIIPVGTMKHPFDFSVHKKVQKVIRDFQPHIIHGAVFEGVGMAVINGAMMKVPIVIMEETSDPTNRKWKANLLMKAYSVFADCCVGVSQAATDYLLKTARIRPSKVRLINNGVQMPRDVDEHEINELRKSLGIGQETCIIGSVGRMSDDSHKRFSDLLKAFAVLVHKDYDIKLLLVGDGELLESYKQQAEDLQIAQKVIFAGYHEDTAKFYHLMDVFSLTSGREAFGLVLAEAMFCKKPVVATRVGGMKYIVKDGHTGFLVEKFDVPAIAKALEELYLDRAKAKEFGIKGYERVIKEYSEEVYVERVENLYKNLLESKNLTFTEISKGI